MTDPDFPIDPLPASWPTDLRGRIVAWLRRSTYGERILRTFADSENGDDEALRGRVTYRHVRQVLGEIDGLRDILSGASSSATRAEDAEGALRYEVQELRRHARALRDRNRFLEDVMLRVRRDVLTRRYSHAIELVNTANGLTGDP